VNAAPKVQQPTSPVPAAANDDFDEEITIECRVKVPTPAEAAASRKTTTRLTKVDARLLAMARGEIEPDDLFGGLIPIYDKDDAEALEAEQAWLMLEPEAEAAPSDADEFLLGRTIPAVRMRASELFALPLEQRSTLFLSQIDGRRSVEELVDICGLDDLTGLEIVYDLMRLGAIELR
jgi:hypothetical protein